jgi:Cu(I)/Ag(I) efflux system protein CusF
MVFAVRDKAMLDAIQPGDKVRFKAADQNGKIVVMELVAAK